MARGPQSAKARDPSPDPRGDVITGEIVEGAEGAMAMALSAGSQLDASLAVALSEAELDRQIVTAHKYPRPIQAAIEAITTLACRDAATAAECQYSVERGKDSQGRPKFITGPSVRFMELVAQQFGNNRVAARVVAVDRKEKFVEAEGIYHDLETNFAISARVRRRISGRDGRLYNDDMITVTGNAAASIALRNAIQRGVPKPIWTQAYSRVQGVIRGTVETMVARRTAILTRFDQELGVGAAQVYAILGVKGPNDVGLDQLVHMNGIFTALSNNEITVEDLLREAAPAAGPGGLGDAFGGAKHDAVTGEIVEVAAPAPAGAPPAEPGNAAASSDSAGATHGPPESSPPSGDGASEEGEERQGETTLSPAISDDSPGAEVEDVQDGCAGPGESYYLARDERDEGGRRRVYVDGAPFGLAGASVEHMVYRSHSPTRAAAPAPGWVEECGARLRACDSWLTVKAALSSIRKTAAYAESAPEAQREVKVMAYDAVAALVETGRDPVRADNDPAFYSLWLEVGPDPTEIDEVWASLVRAPAYKALKETARDQLAKATAEARGDEL